MENINGTERTTSYTYDEDNRVTSVTNGAASTHYYYDDLGRVERQETKQNGVTVLTEYFTYVFAGATETTVQIETYRTVASDYDVTYTYTYDDNGNILTVNDGTYTTSYVYDSQNQLIRENNQQKNRTYVWTYDAAGNRLSSDSYAYTLDEIMTSSTPDYTYGDEDWGDLLTQSVYNIIQNDAIGNLTLEDDLEYPGVCYTYTWEHGRELASFGDYIATGREWQYTYDANGMRTKRTDGFTEYNYVYNGNLLSSMTVDDHTFYFTYDATGTPQTVTLDGTTYYYATNIQGDVIAILDAGGNTAVTYTYDAWGNLLSLTGSMASTLGALNPLRYRGYVYDTETYLYYLQSRYYNPGIGRFINADGFISTGQGFVGNNMFVYCGNNPVMFSDPTGMRYEISAGGGGGGRTIKLGNGWYYRIDAQNTTTETKRHIHIWNNKKEYIQNDDGSPHDQRRGEEGKIPKWLNKEIKEKTGWDYNGNRQSFFEQTICNAGVEGMSYTFADGVTAFRSHNSLPYNPLSVNSYESVYFKGSVSYSNTTNATNIFYFPIIGPITLPAFSFGFGWGFLPIPLF